MPEAATELRPPATVRLAPVERITLREIRLALKEPFRISSGVISSRRILLLQLTDADGVSAWSECVAFERPIYSSETTDTAWFAIREWLTPRLIGRELEGPAAVHDLLEPGIAGHNMAKAAVEMGCWALAAERAQVPLSQLLGGTRSCVATGISLGIQPSPEQIVEQARRAVADGYRKIKVKIQPGADVDYVSAVRAALGDSVELMADANSAYTLEGAAALAPLDDLGLIMIEQPLHRDDLYRHSLLQQRLSTPICLDESVTDVQRCEDMIAMRAGRIVNIKPGRVGGFTSSMAIHDLCSRHGIPVWCGGMLESGIGRSYNVALASLPGFSLPGDLSPSARYWQRDIVTPEWTMQDGMVRVPTTAGLGVTVDVDRIDDLTERTETC